MERLTDAEVLDFMKEDRDDVLYNIKGVYTALENWNELEASTETEAGGIKIMIQEAIDFDVKGMSYLVLYHRYLSPESPQSAEDVAKSLEMHRVTISRYTRLAVCRIYIYINGWFF